MNFIIYGAGVYGKKIFERWHAADDVTFLGYYDRVKSGDMLGIPIIKMEKGDRNIPVLISLYNTMDAFDVYVDLREKGFKNIFWYKGNPYTNVFAKQIIDMNSLGDAILPQVEMHISDCCNLNCVGCTHFSPLFHKIDADFETRINDIKNLKKKVTHIMGFNLLGGEPFLNPEIGEYVREIRRLLPNTRLNIVTNGILLPKVSKDILKQIKLNEVVINITEYIPTNKIINEIQKCLDEAQLMYKIRKTDNLFNKPLDLRKEKYNNKCISNGCVNIYNGKISRCPTLMYVNKFNETFEQKLPMDGIMPIINSFDGKEFLKKLREPVPLCSYCVENPIKWSRCSGKPTIKDFAEI